MCLNLHLYVSRFLGTCSYVCVHASVLVCICVCVPLPVSVCTVCLRVSACGYVCGLMGTYMPLYVYALQCNFSCISALDKV